MQRSSPRASIGFSRLAASIAPSVAPAPTIVCSSSMNRMIWPSAVLDLLEHGLEPLLELAAVLRAGDQGADVERDHAAVAQRLGDVAVDDPLGETLDDRRLADPGLADQDGVVLRPAREHLDHPADLLVAADHRIELVLTRVGRQVAAELLQRLGHLLGVRGGDSARALGLVDGADQRVAVGEDVGDPAGRVGEREQEMADRDVLVVAGRHFGFGPLKGGDEALGGADLGGFGATGDRQSGDRLARAVGDRGDVGGELSQRRGREAVLLLEQRDEHVSGHQLGVAKARRELLRSRDGLLGLDCESVSLHRARESTGLGIACQTI